MKTQLSPEHLAEVHTEGRRKAGRFVNPHTIARCKLILAERGEEWAASVLLRPLERRSRLEPSFPWLEDGEDEMLVMADHLEWALLWRELQS